MISIKSFSKPKNVNGSTVRYIGGNGFAGNSTINVGGSNGVYLWGQWHDHTQDINGDLTSNGTVQANNLVALNNVNTYTANVQGKLTAGEIETSYLSGTTIDTDTIVGALGKFTTLSATTLSAITAFITTLNSTNITTDYLTVTKAAHFFKLIIDEIKATKGQIIITPSNATIDKVTTLSNGNYRCYFRAKDGEGREIYQTFEVDDQVVCQTFNAATGTSYNVSNKYYWRKVVNVSTATTNQTIDGVSYPCHWIDISNTDKDTQCTDIPERYDEIVQLGNRTDTTRQAAITIGAYNNPYLDTGITAPFIIQYAGINDYNLSTHRVNVISNGYNSFKGAFMTNNGDDVETLIHEVSSGATTYVHQAWSNSADGHLNFSKTYFNDALYVGFCSNWTESDTALVYTDYTWARLKGEDGQDGSGSTIVKLSPLVEEVYIDRNDFCVINIAYNIVKQEGSTISTLTASTSNYYVRFRPYKLNGSGSTVNLSTGVTPSYLNYEYQDDWSDRNDALQYLQVELVKGSTVYDKRIVNAILAPAASLEITDSIITRVQGNEQSISSNTNAISSLNQQFNSINATVTAHTAQISNLDQDIYELSTDVSNLEIRADGISSMVSKYSGVQLINAYGWTKMDGTAAKYNADTQGYSLEYDDNNNCPIFSNVVKLDASKEYVFSCYSSIENPPLTVYYSATNKPPIEFSTTVSTVLTKNADDTYNNAKRHAYKFTATNGGYYVIKYGVTSPVTNAFYRPQLERGTEPTEFDLNSVMLGSEIVQNANNILLQVAGCGININDQQITLRGNTEVAGNLKLSHADQGFILVGSGGTTVISPQSIGTYNQFTAKTTSDEQFNANQQTVVYPYQGTSTIIKYTGTLVFENPLGYIKSGTTLTLTNQNINIYYASGTRASTYTPTVEYKLYINGSVEDTITNNAMATSNVGTFTTDASGEYTIETIINFNTIDNYTLTDTNVLGTFVYNINIPLNDAYTMIGYDGIASNFGNNKTVYIGKDEMTMKYSSTSGLRITADKITKLNPNGGGNWVQLSTQKVTLMPNSDYNLQDDDDFVVLRTSSANRTITLTTSQYTGRKVYIKNLGTHTLYVSAPSKMVRCDKNINQVDDDVVINDAHPRMFMYDGTYWYEFLG